MSQIAAIALLALRHVVRSRVVLVLSALLFAAAFLLPLALRSDGTPEGLIRIHLAYVLGLGSFLLTLATLWAGCAAVAQEADEKTLQMLLVKPVPRLRIWLGKWLALLLLDAALLALVGAAAAATLQIQLRRGGFAPEALAGARQTTLAALETLRAPLPDVEADVRAEFERLRAGRRLPDAPEATILQALRRTALARRYAVAPGESRTWTFALPEGAAPGPLLVQFRCDSSVPGAADVRGTLTLDLAGRTFARDVRAMPGTVQTVAFEELPAAPAAVATFSNAGAHDATLFFDPETGLVLRRPAGTFAGNYLRALGQLYLRLALFAAVGVALGTLFSLPVATFLTLVLILVLQLSGFIVAAAQVDRATFVKNVAPFGRSAHVHGDAAPPAPSAAARAAAAGLFYAYRATYLTLRPLLEDRTVDALATGTWLPPRDLARNAVQQGLVLPLLLGLLSAAVLRNREWALPSTS
ncbi:MAG TPA: ABC transporter permease subunit [Kiritimatiellia bacterium]|nr:ABC transporter permease subunit [Kiritimatiellia bacterium]